MLRTAKISSLKSCEQQRGKLSDFKAAALWKEPDFTLKQASCFCKDITSNSIILFYMILYAPYLCYDANLY